MGSDGIASMQRDAREYRKHGSCSGGAAASSAATPPPGPPPPPAHIRLGRATGPFTHGSSAPTFPWLSSTPTPLINGVPGWPARVVTPTTAPTDTVVDVYLSAGPIENYRFTLDSGGVVTPDGVYAACSNDNVGNCSLYRVRIRIGDGANVEAVQLVVPGGKDVDTGCPGGLGAVQAAISPSGHAIAFSQVCMDGDAGQTWRQLVTGLLIPEDWGTGSNFIEGARGEELSAARAAQFPNWWDDGTLLFGVANGGTDQPSLLQGSFSELGGTVILGAGSTVEPLRGFQDVNTSRADGRIVTFGGTSDTDLLPQVEELNGSGVQSFDTSGAYADGFTDCHHPAWSPEGDAILCTRVKEPETVEGYEESDRIEQQLLYRFTFDGTRWANPDRLFTPSPPSALDTSIFPPPESGEDPLCTMYVYKFAEWCGSSDWIVATLFCANYRWEPTTDTSRIFRSRVMLIDIRVTESPVYYDITSMVETATGAEAGSFTGIYSTCTASSGPTLPTVSSGL